MGGSLTYQPSGCNSCCTHFMRPGIQDAILNRCRPIQLLRRSDGGGTTPSELW